MIRSIAYIGNSFKAMLVTAAAVAVLSAGILCCCLTKHAQAAQQVRKSCGHCPKTDTSKTAKPKTCECCKVTPADLDHQLVKFDLVPSFVHHVHAVIIDVVYRPHSTFVRLAYTGPPRANMSLPIYLQQSALRL
jgi:hypothetical protein